jgi:hypothetical protein
LAPWLIHPEIFPRKSENAEKDLCEKRWKQIDTQIQVHIQKKWRERERDREMRKGESREGREIN